MDDDLPSEYDLIVIGTGLTESIVAAAASRIGKSVLHLDTNEYYGGFWSSFNLESLRKYVEDCRKDREVPTHTIENNSIALESRTFLKNVSEDWFNFEEFGDVDDWNKEKILKEFRRFNVDLSPKLLYSRGALVELLISSNICRYAEFRAVDRVATILDDKIMTVPSSRSDVFTNKDVNVVEKRLLMKFLTNCMNFEKDGGENLVELENKTFLEYLTSNQLTPNLIHYILYAISMGNDKTPCRDGLEAVKKFLTSLGRYGTTPFLFPMYGCGEIPQCFCRLCAVFGGIYCLKKEIQKINLIDEKFQFESISCGEKDLKAKDLVLGQGYISGGILGTVKDELKSLKCGNLARGIFLTTIPLGGHAQNTGGGGVAFMKLPPKNEGGDEGAFVIQMAHYSGTCPKEIYLIHMTCKSMSDDPKADLQPYVEQLLSNDIPKKDEEDNSTASTVLYSLYFNIPGCIQCENDHKSPPEGVHLACGPFYELDYDKTIDQAQQIFKKIYPEDEFLPRAPDPEEIIIGEDENVDEDGEAKVDDAVECLEGNDSIESGEECTEQK